MYWLIADGDRTRFDRPFQVRDGLAGKQVEAILYDQGFLPGDEFLNFPPQPGHEGDRFAKIDTSKCRQRDLLTTYTRVPKSDLEQNARKKVPRGCTDLEYEVIDEWAPYVSSASRKIVQLAEGLHDKLPPGCENRRRMSFYEARGAPYNELSACDGSPVRSYSGGDHRTPVFCLRVPKLRKRDFGYLGIWGVDGDATLIGACLLRRRHKELLSKPGFVMAELTGAGIPERPLDLSWTLDWTLEILIDERLPGAPKPRRTGPQAGARI